MEHHKILMKIAAAVTLPDELSMLGIWLGCDPDDVRRLKNRNHSLKDAAYEILCSFYNFVPNHQRWGILTSLERAEQACQSEGVGTGGTSPQNSNLKVRGHFLAFNKF